MSVRRLIREQAKRSSATASPGAIAAAVLRQLNDAELRDALRVALPYLVRDEVRKIRHKSLGVSDPRARENWGSNWPTATPPARVRQLREAGRKGFDAAQAKRERESELLRTRIALAKGQWKALGDCTPADLRQLARANRKHAQENIARAEGYERIADDMAARGIEQVRDYHDVPLIRQVFRNAA